LHSSRLKRFSPQVDVWSCATIFAEMSTGLPLVPGDSEIDQIFKIFRFVRSTLSSSLGSLSALRRLMGTPTEQTWPGLKQMPDYKASFPQWRATDLRQLLPEMDDRALHLLNGMLQIDPEKRISGAFATFPLISCASLALTDIRMHTAKQALRHHYFHARPAAPSPHPVPPLSQPLSPLLNPWGTTGPPCAQQFAAPAGSHAQRGTHPLAQQQQQQQQSFFAAAQARAGRGSAGSLQASPIGRSVPRGEGLMASPMH
jgi:cyclin-dependent kinase